MNINFKNINLFFKGLSFDVGTEFKSNDTYQYGLNGRLYSKNGKLSFSSIKGTIEIYNNLGIIKYLGGFAFNNEMILIAKYNNSYSETLINTINNYYTTEDQEISFPLNPGNRYTGGLNLSNGLKEHIINSNQIQELTEQEIINDDNETILEEISKFNILDYFTLSNISLPNFEICSIQQEETIPENNKNYSDVIISIKKNNGALIASIIWNGYLNLDIKRKIEVIGIEETSSIKRIYFTDTLNPFRTFNAADKNLLYKRPESFDVIQDITLLQPEIINEKNDGKLTSGKVQYLYKLISKNGQISPYSPFSKLYDILKDTDKVTFKGGSVNEITNKSLEIRCPIIDYLDYEYIECIALEYGLKNAVTSIKSLGIKPVDEVVNFIHTGNEAEYSEIISLAEILDNSSSWKYCNSLAIKNNKLIPAGLRNNPYPVNIKTMEDMFLLKGWDENGNTHNSLINPYPQTYKYIDPANTDKYYTVSKKQITLFKGFGNFTIKFYNKLTDSSIEKSFTSNDINFYKDYIDDIFNWISDEPNLNVNFPNLKVEKINNSIVFSRNNPLILTDFNDYIFIVNEKQIIIDFKNEYELNTNQIATNKLIHGAISYGFNQGTGIRLSWEIEDDPLMNKSKEEYNKDYLFPLYKPSMKKSFMKGEIYRLGIQCYKSGELLFVIPLGDIKAPEIGDSINGITTQGINYDPINTPIHFLTKNGNLSDTKYTNQIVKDNTLYARRLLLKTEVRFGKEFKDFIDNYRIVYVERTEDNRTILAQGISGPLQRINKYKNIILSSEDHLPQIFRKWTLPYFGGPLHDNLGFKAYDTYGENFEETQSSGETVARRRVLTHRRLFYFDSPDLIYGDISDKNIPIANINVLGRLKTDHSRINLSNIDLSEPYYEDNTDSNINNDQGNYFSKRIWEGGRNSILLENNINAIESEDKNYKPYFIDCSIFSNFEIKKSTHEIEKNITLNDGDVSPSSQLNMAHEISNNALTLGRKDWFYSTLLREGSIEGGTVTTNSKIQCQFMKTCNISTGYRSLFIKTKDNVFTNDFLGNEIIKLQCNYNLGNRWFLKEGTDSHALINLKLNNENTVYGGRSKFAYSKNIFIPLGPIVPLFKETNQAQINTIEGDTYVTLFLRTKNTYHNHIDFKEHDEIHNSTASANKSHDEKEWNRGGAWMYGVVLETMIEEKMSYDYRHYRQKSPLNFNLGINEVINKAYATTDSIKSLIPRPFNYIDNPLSLNTIAASKVKVTGDKYDSFLQFLTNNFYDLEKKNGDISNIIDIKNRLIVFQKNIHSEVVIEPSDTLTTNQGSEIQVQNGSGNIFISDKEISKYGTSIKRSVITSDYGYYFYDENKNEFIKNGESLSLKHDISLELDNLFNNNKVVDVNGYFDYKYKEAVLTLKTENDNYYTLSYNEVLQAFNGYYEYENDFYISFDNKVYTPKKNEESSLNQLNSGDYLNLFGTLKTMKIGIIVKSEDAPIIFKELQLFTNIDYKIKELKINDNINPLDIRIINKNHFRYFLKEGIHEIPLKNENDRNPKRGKWGYIEIEIESIENKKVDLYQIVTYVRKSLI